jgi:hypothetical protein
LTGPALNPFAKLENPCSPHCTNGLHQHFSGCRVNQQSVRLASVGSPVLITYQPSTFVDLRLIAT